MISTRLSEASAVFLALCGMLLLFAADALLPLLVPGFPPNGAWIGQLLGAAWLGLAAMNWLSRTALLGGIYGRAVVMANTAAYFIAAMTLTRVVAGSDVTPILGMALVPLAGFATMYSWLLFRGPLERDLQAYRGGGDAIGDARA